jgi:haloacetate dehalogenase
VRDDMEEIYVDPVEVWRARVDGPLSGARIDPGHHMAAEAPEGLTAVLAGFRDA